MWNVTHMPLVQLYFNTPVIPFLVSFSHRYSHPVSVNSRTSISIDFLPLWLYSITKYIYMRERGTSTRGTRKRRDWRDRTNIRNRCRGRSNILPLGLYTLVYLITRTHTTLPVLDIRNIREILWTPLTGVSVRARKLAIKTHVDFMKNRFTTTHSWETGKSHVVGDSHEVTKAFERENSKTAPHMKKNEFLPLRGHTHIKGKKRGKFKKKFCLNE